MGDRRDEQPPDLSRTMRTALVQALNGPLRPYSNQRGKTEFATTTLAALQRRRLLRYTGWGPSTGVYVLTDKGQRIATEIARPDGTTEMQTP